MFLNELVQQTWQNVQQLAYTTFWTVELEAAKVDTFLLSWLGLRPAVAAYEACPSLSTSLGLGSTELGIIGSGSSVFGNDFNPTLTLSNDALGIALTYKNPEGLALAVAGAVPDVQQAIAGSP